MPELTTKKRNSLKKSTFGLPKERKYPMPDKSHAANAKARATQMVKKGKLSEEKKEKIDTKANKILHHANQISHHIDKIKNGAMKKMKTMKKEPKMNKMKSY